MAVSLSDRNTMIILEPKERDMILAALGLWQETEVKHQMLLDIAQDHDGSELTNDEINRLCEELNT